MGKTTAILAGLAAGIVIGMLIAPEKGSATRNKIREEGKKLADELKDGWRKAKEKFEQADTGETV